METEAVHGLHSIELRTASPRHLEGKFCLARYEPTGNIVLFDLPVPPWSMRGHLSSADEQRISTCGGIVDHLEAGLRTVVHWPGDSLRDFVVLHGLIHEMAHHVIQQYTGKRVARVRRTQDHERFAERFVTGHQWVIESLSRGGP
jgi:hypothetical protein